MGKRKVSFADSGTESSRKSSAKKSKSDGDEATSSKKGKELKITSKEKELLKNDKAEMYYKKDMGFREIELGRNIDFEWLSKEDTLNVDSWLNIQGWTEFLQVNESVYPRLIRILFANLNPYEMKSSIGNISVKLDEEAWCATFNLPKITPEGETQVRTLSKEELFFDLTKKDGQGVRNWINVNELPKEPNIRLAALLLQTTIIQKKGSKEQIKEEEGRILYAMKYGLEINLAREIVERIKQSTVRKSTPLCYGMHLMVMMRNAGINLKCAGDTEFRELRVTSFINSKTLGRLGFKKDITRWDVTSKKTVSSKFSAESHPQMQAETSQAAGEEGAAESSMPKHQTPRTKYQDTSTQIPHLTNLIQTLQTSLNHFASHFTERLDYHAATTHSRLESMDSKLDELTIHIKYLESKLIQPTSTQSPSTSHQTSQQPSTSKAIPTPTAHPNPTHSADSPVFTMEELTTTPSTQPPQPTQLPPSSTLSQPQAESQAPSPNLVQPESQDPSPNTVQPETQAQSPNPVQPESQDPSPNLVQPEPQAQSPNLAPPTSNDPSSNPVLIDSESTHSDSNLPIPSPKSTSSSPSSSSSNTTSPIRPIPPISTLPKDTPIPTHPPTTEPQSTLTPPTQTLIIPPSTSEKTLAQEFVQKTLQLSKRTRTKRCATRHTFKLVPKK